MNWQSILVSLPGIILGLTVHEFCHALAAYKLGDRTAREQGRLSFNPLKHIDPIGFLFIVIAGFGWAKPVQFNPANLSHYRRDKAIIAGAGPVSNFLFALLLILVTKGIQALALHFFMAGNWQMYGFFDGEIMNIVILVIFRALVINLGLGIFNLMPLPPLDGSHIFLSGLNLRPETESRIMKIGAPLLFIAILIQNRTDLEILPVGRLSMAILGLFFPELRSS